MLIQFILKKRIKVKLDMMSRAPLARTILGDVNLKHEYDMAL